MLLAAEIKNFEHKVSWSCELPLFLKFVLPCKGQTILTKLLLVTCICLSLKLFLMRK